MSGYCLPEPQRLLGVEVNIFPRNELRTDVHISRVDEGTPSLLVLVRAYVRHWGGGGGGRGGIGEGGLLRI